MSIEQRLRQLEQHRQQRSSSHLIVAALHRGRDRAAGLVQDDDPPLPTRAELEEIVRAAPAEDRHQTLEQRLAAARLRVRAYR